MPALHCPSRRRSVRPVRTKIKPPYNLGARRSRFHINVLNYWPPAHVPAEPPSYTSCRPVHSPAARPIPVRIDRPGYTVLQPSRGGPPCRTNRKSELNRLHRRQKNIRRQGGTALPHRLKGLLFQGQEVFFFHILPLLSHPIGIVRKGFFIVKIDLLRFYLLFY